MPAIVYDFLVSLTYPPLLSLCLLLCAAVAAILRWRVLGGALATCALGWSLLWSIPYCSEQLRGTLERRHPVIAETALPTADAIVVLGGGRHRSWIGRANIDPDELKTSRLAAGARAWLAGRAPLIILSGGGNGGGGTSEAGAMAVSITKMGVPASALILEDRSGNTRDNARLTAALARRRGIRNVLLVTSSVHMPRASLMFRDAGVELVPVPVPERRIGTGWRERWLPSTRALWRSGRALKEYAGLLAVNVEITLRDVPGRDPAGRRNVKSKSQTSICPSIREA